MPSSSRTARFVKWGSIPAGLALSSLLIWHASYAAFSDTTENPGNSWEAGKVQISDDHAKTAMFTVKDIVPGDTDTNTIVTTYSGTVDADTRLYGTNETTTNDLAKYIDLKIVPGTGADPVFSGTLADFAAKHTDYAQGIELGSVEGGSNAKTPYTFTYTLRTDTPDTAQGGTAAIGFTWEAQSVSE